MKHPDLLAIEGIEALGDDACFHDAEVRRLELKVDNGVAVLTLDLALPRGNATLIFDDVEEPRFDGFNGQNALFDLSVEKVDAALRVSLNPAYGVGGEFRCSKARLADGALHL